MNSETDARRVFGWIALCHTLAALGVGLGLAALFGIVEPLGLTLLTPLPWLAGTVAAFAAIGRRARPALKGLIAVFATPTMLLYVMSAGGF